jgi:hypothetical protein
MKRSFLLIIAILAGFGSAQAQTKDPMKTMDHMHMNHGKTAAPAKPAIAKKQAVKKKVIKKPAKKTVVKKKTIPGPAKPADHSMHRMTGTKSNIKHDSSAAPMDHQGMHNMPANDSATMKGHTMHNMDSMGHADTTRQGLNSAAPAHDHQTQGMGNDSIKMAGMSHDSMTMPQMNMNHMDTGHMDMNHMDMSHSGQMNMEEMTMSHA